MRTNRSEHIQPADEIVTETVTKTQPAVEPVPAGSAEFVARIKAILAAA